MNKIDLHIHSCHSDDGEFTIEQIVDRSLSLGMMAIAITDHNSVAGVLKAVSLGRDKGLQVVPGIEIDCHHGGRDLHLLGYHIDATDPRYHELEKNILQQERWAGVERIARFSAYSGLSLRAEKIIEAANGGVITGERIAEYVLLEQGFMGAELLKPYREGGARSDMPYVNFYWDFFAKGAPAYVPMTYPSLEDAVKLVRQTGGVPVLAHPGKNVGRHQEVLCDIMSRGVAGLEVFCSYHSREESQLFYDLALRHGWMMSCGSDFHGKNKPQIQIGDCRCEREDNCCFTGSLVLKYSC